MRIDALASGAQSWSNAFVSAVLGGASSSGQLPDLLMYYPVAQINPYQQLLYAAAQEHGLTVLPVLQLETITQAAWCDKSILHLHWLAGILRHAKTEDEANQAVEYYKQLLSTWRDRGIRIVWTIHNVLPHNTTWPDAELALRQLTSDAADLIHVMNGDTLRLTAPHFSIDSKKVIQIAHPSYADWYANVESTEQARQDVGLQTDDFVYLCFGSIQPYKGLTELVDAYDVMRARNPAQSCVLVIAGQVDDESYFTQLQSKIQRRNDVLLLPGNVRDQRIQSYFNACNVVVTPYLATLNSGVALLAASFRRMVVAPATGGMADVFSADKALLYDNDVPGALTVALERAVHHQPAAGLFNDILRDHHPTLISNKLCIELRKLLGHDNSENVTC